MIKLLKQLFPFIFASFFITTKPKRIPKTNAKFNNFFQTCSSQLLLQPHLNINNQPQINWKKNWNCKQKKNQQTTFHQPSPNIARWQPKQTTRPELNWKIATKLNQIMHMPMHFCPIRITEPPIHRTTDPPNHRTSKPPNHRFTEPPTQPTTTCDPHLHPTTIATFMSNGVAICARWWPTETVSTPSGRSAGPGKAAPVRGAHAGPEATKLLQDLAVQVPHKVTHGIEDPKPIDPTM